MSTETTTTTAQAPATAAEVKAPANATPAAETKPLEAKTEAVKTTETKAPEAKVTEEKAPAPADADSKKTEEKKEEAQAVDPKKETPAVPEKYELKIPEGSNVDQAEVAKVEAFAKERGLDNKSAQAVLEGRHALVAEQQSNLETLNGKTWKDELIADKDFGGEKFEESGLLAYDAAKRFGGEGFAEELKVSKLNHHPDLFRMLVRVGQAMQDDKFVNTNNVVKSKENKPLEEQMYPNMYENKGA